MDWNSIRGQWQDGVAPPVPENPLAALQRRDRELRATLWRRDAIETAVALLVAPMFAFAAWRAGGRGAWDATFFSAFLATWAGFVPLWMWRARRRLPTARHDLALRSYLAQTQLAIVAQAQMLERIWRWYLAPCAFGVIGLQFSATGPTAWAWAYAAIVLAFCVALAGLNRRAARTRLRPFALELERSVATLDREDAE
jgi:hypothetical protein